MRGLLAAERLLLAAERALLGGLLLVLVALSFLQLVLRGGFSAGLLWADVFLRHFVLLIGFLGAGVAAAEGRMFCFDAASHFLRGPWLRAARSLAHAFACAACAALSSAAWTFFQEEWRAGGTLFSVMGLNVPQWTFVLVVPAGFCLLCLHHGIRAAASAAAPRP